MNDERSQITSILSTLQKIMPTIIEGEMKTESKMESKMKTEMKSKTRDVSAVDSKYKDTNEGTGTVTGTGTDIDADTNDQAAIVVDGHSFLNMPLADNEIQKEEYTIVMKPDGKNEIIDSKTEKIIL
jgi:hypothetical protein